MRFTLGAKGTGGFGEILHGILQPAQRTMEQRLGQLIRQGLAVVLSALIIVVPIGQGTAFAQSAPAQPMDNGQAAQQPPPPLAPDQLDQLVAPIALYPDALVAQVLAGATYPNQVTEADQWRQAQGNAPADQIAAAANAHSWDPSIKALTAFPTVLAQMDKNIQWTTDLGNAYFNQPQDVMDAVQAMRQKAQAAGQLHSTTQLAVNVDNGLIVIAPADPAVVYVPIYNPWAVYGVPIAVYPGFYWAPPPGIVWGGVGIAFGIGIGVAAFASFGWGWGHWGVGWHDHAVVYNHGAYFPHNPGGYGHGGIYARGGYGRGGYGRGGGFNRGGGYAGNRGGRTGGGFNRGGAGSRGAAYGANRGGANRGGANRGGGMGRSSGTSRAATGHAGTVRSGGGRATTARSGGASAGHATTARSSGAGTGRATMARSSGGAGHSSGGTSHAMASHSSGGGGGHSTMARSSGGGHPSGGGSPHAMASHSGGGGGGHAAGGGGHAGGGGGHKR